MATLYKVLVLTTLTSFISFSNLFSQDTYWEWAKKVSETSNTPFIEVQATDSRNNIFCISQYSDVIIFPDTSFNHPGHEYSENYAISKYNASGEFVNVIDIFTWPNNKLRINDICIDNNNNLLVAGEFCERVFFQDTFLVHLGGPYPEINNEIFLIKYSPDYDIIWSGVIGSQRSNTLDGMASKNNITSIATYNYLYNQTPNYLYLFGNDSILINRECISLFTIDSNRDIIWKKQIVGAETIKLHYGEDGILYYTGYTNNDIVIENDTILHLDPENPYKKFTISFDDTGHITSLISYSYNLDYYNIVTNTIGEHYISGIIRDSLFINDENIIVPEDHIYQIIIKLNPDATAHWYQIIDYAGDQYINKINTLLSKNTLVFSTTGRRDIQLGDTTFSFLNKTETIFGELSPEGNITNLITTKSASQTVITNLITDNCANIISNGYYWGTSIIGNDTLYQNQSGSNTGFYSKINRNPLSIINLGNDTTVCDNYTITAPKGFDYYIWNDSMTYDTTFTTFETGVVKLECSTNDGCWLQDEIFIDIHKQSDLIISSDTTIATSDSIIITIENDYESILWFNGSSSNTITISGENYIEGTYNFWVEAFDGICTSYDTISISFENNDFINEQAYNKIDIFPIPITNTCVVKSKTAIKKIIIYNQCAITVFAKNIRQDNISNIELNLEHLNQGIYYAVITDNSNTYLRKIVKL